VTRQSDSRHADGEALSGQETTDEQLSDVYAAGTSDGIVQLADKTVAVDDEGYESET